MFQYMCVLIVSSFLRLAAHSVTKAQLHGVSKLWWNTFDAAVDDFVIFERALN